MVGLFDNTLYQMRVLDCLHIKIEVEDRRTALVNIQALSRSLQTSNI